MSAAMIGSGTAFSRMHRLVACLWLVLGGAGPAGAADAAIEQWRLDSMIRVHATVQASLASSFPEHSMPRLLRFSNGKRIGYMDAKGKIVVPPVFDGADFFMDGNVRIRLNGKYGFIDANGKVIVEPKYEDLPASVSFPLPAKLDGRWGLVDANGEWLVIPTYERLEVQGDLLIVGVNGKRGAVDLKGRTVLEPVFDAVRPNGSLIAVRRGGMWGLWNRSGKAILKEEYRDIRTLAGTPDYAIVLKDGKEGLVGADGSVVIPLKYGKLYPTQDRQRWIAQSEAVYGVVDLRGNEVIKQRYSAIGTNGKDHFNVTNAGMSALADIDGRLLTEFTFQEIGYFNNGLAPVKIKGKWGYIDNAGKVVIEARFDSARQFADDLAVVSTAGKYGYVDKKGRLVVKPQFEDAYDFFRDGIAVVKSEGRYAYVDRNLRRIGDWIRADVPTQPDFALPR